ncbi:hypothetical protein ELH72_08600 [Rhizobium ruizarguesonis]|jgi:hypothetical protein|uniref:hypothetical protein n=1 Tax=Rhizobium TaxID=379 RepID=UPI000FEC7335|nr:MULTISPECIES: hypothetical protein [Rhizobium]RWX40278.1 hypothetical protein EHH54_13150 [Rhizobium leguminosarum]TAZ83319.1 hypothetical protein ELH72_08600 [Rhizobium ruizarguesonis]
MTQIHPVLNNQTAMAKIEWDPKESKFVANLVDLEEAHRVAADLHPPTVTPIRGDPNHVIRCDWSLVDNRYVCRIIPNTDPDARA